METIILPNAQNFKPFGKIIEYPNYVQKGQTRNLWRIVHRESAKVGWRIAYLILRDKSIGQFGMHPTSDETFEPIKGEALLFVSKNKHLRNVKCFKLNRPIILKKGVWHNILTVSQETHIKIFENARVTQKVWKLKFRFKSFKELQKRIKENAQA